MKRKNTAPPPSMLRPLLLVALGVALIGTAAYILIFRPLDSRNLVEATPVPTVASDVPYPDVERISAEEAKQALDDGSAVFVDTRSPDSYAQYSIPGAINIPVDELESRLSELDKDTWYITFCT